MYLIAGKYNHLNPEGTFVCCLIKSHFSQRKIVHPIAVLLQAMRLLFSLTYVKIKNYFFRLLSQRREPKDSNFNKLASIGDKLSFSTKNVQRNKNFTGFIHIATQRFPIAPLPVVNSKFSILLFQLLLNI